MGWFKKVLDAHAQVCDVDEEMIDTEDRAHRAGRRVNTEEHARLQQAAEEAAAARRNAFWGRS